MERRAERNIRGGKALNIKQYQEKLAQNSAKIGDALVPQTFTGRLRRAVVHRIPFTSLRESLEQRPIEGAIHELREPIIDLYNNLGDIIREGAELVEFHNDVRELFEDATLHPEDEEAVRALRDKLREKAEKDLNIKRDSDTEDLLAQVLEPDDPAAREERRKKTLFESEQVLSVAETIAHIGENIATITAQTYESMNAQYALLLNIRKMTNVLQRAGSDTINAQALRIEAFNTLVGQIDILLQSADYATEIAQLAEEAQVTVEAEKVKLLSDRAEALKKRTDRMLPQRTDNAKKQLTATASTEKQLNAPTSSANS